MVCGRHEIYLSGDAHDYRWSINISAIEQLTWYSPLIESKCLKRLKWCLGRSTCFSPPPRPLLMIPSPSNTTYNIDPEFILSPLRCGHQEPCIQIASYISLSPSHPLLTPLTLRTFQKDRQLELKSFDKLRIPDQEELLLALRPSKCIYIYIRRSFHS
jgi:hypothetical protein